MTRATDPPPPFRAGLAGVWGQGYETPPPALTQLLAVLLQCPTLNSKPKALAARQIHPNLNPQPDTLNKP